MRNITISYQHKDGTIVARQYSYPRKPRRTTDWRNDTTARERFRYMYARPAQFTLADIGRRFGIGIAHVASIARTLGLPKRKHGSGHWRPREARC